MNQDTEKNTTSPEPETQEKQTGKLPFRINLHIVLLSAIVIIVVVCAYKLYKWNKGKPSDYDPNFQTTEFDVEVLDSIIPLAPDKKKGA